MNNSLQIEQKPISWLRPAVDNPKKHPKKNLARIRASIEQFGWIQPIIARPDGEIIAGHGRQLVALQQGIDTVPVIILDGLTDKQAALLRIVDNRAAEAPWDHKALERTLREFDAADEAADLFLDMDDLTAEIDAETILNEPELESEDDYWRDMIAKQVDRLPDEVTQGDIVVIAPSGGTEALILVDDDFPDLAAEIRLRAEAGEPIAETIAKRLFPMKGTA